jgi:sporulation protein YabP
MENNQSNQNSLRFQHNPFHNIFIKDRKTIEITGVKNIESFDSTEFLIETALGFLNITGNDLVLIKLDQDNSEVIIKGTVESLSYVSGKKQAVAKEKLFSKLLK